MKVLVVGGCATKAYVEFFQKCFPKWETRAALLAQVNEWVDEGNEAFLSYVEEADIFVGLTDREPLKSLKPESSLDVFLPSYDFFGYLPDSIFLLGNQSPLELGVIHSRIAASAFIAGKNEKETLALYNKDHFDKLGYFDIFEDNKTKLFKKFDNANIDLRERFEHWSKDGNFQYTPNHPHTTVFFDIACAAMKNHFPELLTNEIINEARLSVVDYMGDGLIWAMYPEIAQYHGVETMPEKWRTSSIHKAGIDMTLEEFVKASFEKYQALDSFSESNIDALGGLEGIRFNAGCDSLDNYNERRVA